jgi:hypothetical protein
MGIDYKASIFVGLPRDEITNDQLIEDEKLEVCPPYYDGEGDDGAICGFPVQESPTYGSVELRANGPRIDELKGKFYDLTGQCARVYLSTKGW